MPKLFAMAVLYLGQANPESFKPESYLSLLTRKFPDWPLNPILVELDRELQSFRKLSFEKRPSLISLLRHPFEAGKTIIYSLQRQNRDYSGLVVIKSPTGLFLRTRDGTIFQIPQLARSASNLPGYLTNGNTPQGIFSIQGIDTSASLFIGQTPNLQLVLPGEASITKYFHAGTITDTVWTREKYASLLPTEWRDYLPIYQAYNAGLAGRTEIIAHGTTIDPEYYRGQAFYPNTPSLGCLTTLEIWSPVDGHCLFSNQWALTQAFNSTGNAAGYLVVVEIDAQPRPVCLEEVRVVLLQAEGSLPLPDEICE